MEKNDKEFLDGIKKPESRLLDLDELAQVYGGKDIVYDENKKKKERPKIDP